MLFDGAGEQEGAAIEDRPQVAEEEFPDQPQEA